MFPQPEVRERPRDHAATLYEADNELVRLVGGYLAATARSNETAIVAATREHIREFEGSLASRGFDVDALRASEMLVTLDAGDIARRVAGDGAVDADVYDALVGDAVRRAAGRGAPIRIYGEIVALLWDAGNVVAAIEVEELWNRLRRETSFTLLCGYPAASASSDRHAEAFGHVHRLHTDVVDVGRNGASPVDELGVVLRDEERRFPRALDAAREARRFARDVLAPTERAEVVDGAMLVATELATNAIVHARSPFAIRVTRRLGSFRVSVRDQSSAEPRPSESESLMPSGNGLRLVEMIATRWGHSLEPGGKVVWAEFTERP